MYKQRIVILLLSLTVWFMTFPASAEHSDSLVLSDTEHNWLEAHPHIRVGTMDAWPPFNFVESDGTPAGIGSDIIAALNLRLGGRLKVVPGAWQEIYDKVKEGRLDAIMDITPKPEREEFFNFTKPYLDVPHIIVAPKDTEYLENEDDLDGKILALEKGFGNVKYFKQHYPKVIIKEYRDTSYALDAIVRGEADAYAGNRGVALNLIEKELMTNLRIHGRLRKDGSILAMGTRKDWPILRDILQKSLDDITSGEKRTILDRWITVKAEEHPWWQLTQEQSIALATTLATLLFITVLLWISLLRVQITKRTKQLELVNREQELILNNSMIAILLVRQRHIVWANPKAAEMRGVPRSELEGAPTRLFYLSDEIYKQVGELYDDKLSQGVQGELELQMQHGDEEIFWVRVIGQALDPEHPHEGSIWLIENITERRDLRERLRSLALTDSLTGCLNRRAFMSRAEELFNSWHRYRHTFAVLMIDIDHFKKVNDHFGHAAGDQALIAFADTCRTICRDIDVIGRIGGEEFAIILPNTEQPGAEAVAERLLRSVRSLVVEVPPDTIHFTVSAGITLVTKVDDNVEQLLKRSDEALYKAKEGGRNRWVTLPGSSPKA